MDEVNVMAVYCKDCKFLHRNFFDQEIVTCEVIKKVERTDPVTGPYTDIVRDEPVNPHTRNTDCKCPFYQKTFMKGIWDKMWEDNYDGYDGN